MALKVLVEDQDDLTRLSALLQDAIVRVGDIAFLKRNRRLAMTLNRFCWEGEGETDGAPDKKVAKRIACGLRFEFVSSLKAQNIQQSDPEALLYLLAIRFVPENETDGRLEFVFSGDATLVAQVECIDGAASDIGEPWLSENVPFHEDQGDGEDASEAR